MSRVSAGNCIEGFMHCGKCLDERPSDKSPEEWARLSVGFTPIGLQVWCVRHGCNVMHIDFEGRQHPANTEPDDGAGRPS